MLVGDALEPLFFGRVLVDEGVVRPRDVEGAVLSFFGVGFGREGSTEAGSAFGHLAFEALDFGLGFVAGKCHEIMSPKKRHTFKHKKNPCARRFFMFSPKSEKLFQHNTIAPV